MNREESVKLLVQRHNDLANQHAAMSQYHSMLAKDYQDYLYQLQKPGFKTKGWKRFTGKSRIEPYVIQAEGGAVRED